MTRVGMFTQALGEHRDPHFAVDPRIKVLDALDPWRLAGVDEHFAIRPEEERAQYINLNF